jgi:hypothetical protein
MTGIKNIAGMMVGLALICGTAHAADKPVAWRDKVTAFAAEHFKNPAWGYSHFQRDYRLARELAASDHVVLDDDVLFAAAYLHDLGAFDPWANAKQEHGDISAEKIDVVLASTDFPKAKLDAVRAACRTHMFNFTPVGPEARYLHDADDLDWMGAMGIARMLPFVDKKGGKPSGPDMIKGIQADLAAERKGLVTPAGKALLPGRIAEENAFLDALARETQNFAEL